MVAVSLIFTFLCLLAGFGLYIWLLQRLLARNVAQQQGAKVFFTLSYLLAIPLFYGSMFAIMALANWLYPFVSGGHQLRFASKPIEETTTHIAMVAAALLAGLLSVIFWAWALSKKNKN